jgi:hypothetical protein
MNLLSDILPINNEDVVCTLDDEDKNKLLRVKLDNNLDNKCNVCMDDMNKDEEIIILPCKHTYHSNCIDEWLNNYNYKCPICKVEVGKPKYNI